MRTRFHIRWSVLLVLGLLVGHAGAATPDAPRPDAPTPDDPEKRAAVLRTLTDYIDGSGHARPEQLRRAFHPSAVLLLSRQDRPYWPVTVDEYVGWFDGDKAGKPTGRIGNVLSIDIEGDTASAKVEIVVPSMKARFVDLFLLRELDGRWQIMSKTATREASGLTGARVLFIVSSAMFHGKSDLRAGVSLEEVVEARKVFEAAGYTVDFVSPAGGMVPIYTEAVGVVRDHLYDADLMHALAHTASPAQIDPARYRAVYFVGGSNAIYGVPEDPRIQHIAMQVYERNGGVISAVCHGTAGLVNLKLANGAYLVAGKQITGFPEEFERKDAAYLKEFPFLIRRTIESRGGIFSNIPRDRDEPFVKVDGRVVTGQDNLSPKQVAEAVVEVLSASPQAR